MEFDKHIRQEFEDNIKNLAHKRGYEKLTW